MIQQIGTNQLQAHVNFVWFLISSYVLKIQKYENSRSKLTKALSLKNGKESVKLVHELHRLVRFIKSSIF